MYNSHGHTSDQSRFGTIMLRKSRKTSRGSGAGDSKHSEADWPGETQLTTRNQPTKDKDVLELLPDKELEERVLSECSEYLASNMPADDMAPVMLTRNLLTPKEHDEFKAMKRSGRLTTISMSEYLLECLRKRQAGFLKTFCGILHEIEPAKYLCDDIRKAYHEANKRGGFNRNSTDRLSKLSISDPDLRPKTPQGNTIMACTLCKKMKKRNRYLEKQLVELHKDYHRLKETKIKVEGHVEILQDQLQQELEEKDNLKHIIPHLHEAISLIDNSCRRSSSTGASGAQQTLRRISDLMKEQSGFEKNPVLKRMQAHLRDSTMSLIFSDTSSLAETTSSLAETTSSLAETTSSLAEILSDEEVIRSHGSDNLASERHQLSADSKPVFSNLHKSVAHYQTSTKSTFRKNRDFEPSERVSKDAKAAGVQECGSSVHDTQNSSIISAHHGRLQKQLHNRSESSPNMPITKHAKSHVKPRHSSESDSAAMIGRSKSFQHSARQIAENPLIENANSNLQNELSEILTKRRRKVDAENDHEVLTYQSQ